MKSSEWEVGSYSGHRKTGFHQKKLLRWPEKRLSTPKTSNLHHNIKLNHQIFNETSDLHQEHESTISLIKYPVNQTESGSNNNHNLEEHDERLESEFAA